MATTVVYTIVLKMAESVNEWNSEDDDGLDDEVDFTELDGTLRDEMEALLARRLLQSIPSATVTIKFTLNSGERLTTAHDLGTDFGSIKETLATTFNVPAEALTVFKGDREVTNDLAPFDLGAKPFSCLDLRLQSRDPHWQLKSGHLALPTPDILTVNIDGERDIVVEIENRTIRKPYMGGYRDPQTGLEYHHASSQTAPVSKPQQNSKTTRDSQTAAIKTKSTATCIESATQCGEPPFLFERTLMPRPYKPASNFESAVKIIQKYYRAMKTKKKLKELSAEYRKRFEAELEEGSQQEDQVELRTCNDIKRMTCPKTKEDFDVLYAMVERWRRGQTERISQLKTEAPRKAELCTVLEKEVKLLESIEAHRIRARKEQEQIKTRRTLLQAAKPVSWTGYRGIRVSMDTLKTQRARELASLYDELSEHTSISKRVERLIALKHTLVATDTPAAEELMELVDREAELLTRGAKESQLTFLRARIQQQFVRFFRELDRQDGKEKCHMFCKQCRRMRTQQAFSVSSREKEAAICTACKTCYGDARTAQDYRHILRAVRRDEQHRGCYSSCAFVMGDEDIAFLVANIWHGRSLVSAIDDLKVLRLVRWDLSQEWSPWNCVLLTSAEARLHEHVGPTQYGDHLIHDVATKHTLARCHFAQLEEVDTRLRNTGVWFSVDMEQ